MIGFFFLPGRVQEDHPIMSFTVSKNGRLAVLNVATQVSRQTLSLSFFLFFFNCRLRRVSGNQRMHVPIPRECTCGTYRTECWSGNTKVSPRASTPSTRASGDTTKTLLPAEAKVQYTQQQYISFWWNHRFRRREWKWNFTTNYTHN